jgi:hypothetical protein
MTNGTGEASVSDGGFRIITARAQLILEGGGLPRPLALPTQSLVFRFVDGPLAGVGVVAVVVSPDSQRLGRIRPWWLRSSSQTLLPTKTSSAVDSRCGSDIRSAMPRSSRSRTEL